MPEATEPLELDGATEDLLVAAARGWTYAMCDDDPERAANCKATIRDLLINATNTNG